MRSTIVYDLFRDRPVLRPVALFLVVALAAFGIAGIHADVRSSREQALGDWRIRLGLVADERASSVRRWIAGRFGELAGVAENASAQIYLGAADVSDDATDPAARAERQYLENLLTITAERGRFLPRVPPSQVRANVSRPGIAGLAILDKAGRPVAATSDLPPLEGKLAAFLRNADAAGERAVWPMHMGPTGAVIMGFYQPMHAGFGVAEGSERIGAVFGVTEVGADLFELLRDPVPVVETGRAVLLRAERNGEIRVLSPLDDAFGPLDLALSGESANLAAVRALRNPGTSGEGVDIRGEPVLYASRIIEAPGWLLLYTVARSEALGPIESASARRMVLLGAVLAGICLLLVAAWHFGSSRRTIELADRLRESARTVERQRDLLETLANTQRSAIALVGSDDRIAFANAAALGVAAVDQGDVLAKSLDSLFGHAKARALLGGTAEARAAGAPVTRLESVGPSDGAARTLRAPISCLFLAKAVPTRCWSSSRT